jgi:general secretion pathway protein D
MRLWLHTVGVNVDITPKIHGTDEVSLHIEVDISNVKQFLNLGGVQEPDVAQTKIINDVRLKQGEVNLMGGLIQMQENKTINGVPGLGSIPVVGHLFTSEKVTKDQSELVLALIPHIVRAPSVKDVNLRKIGTGNQTVVKLNYAPEKHAETPQPAVAAPAATALPATALPSPSVQAESSPKPVSEAKARVKLVPDQTSIQVNHTITVSLMVEGAVDLASAPIYIRFDPKVLHLNDVIVRGNLLASDSQQVAVSKNVLNDAGEATVTISRFPNTGGVTGSGLLATFFFQAMSKGETIVAIPKLTLRNSQSQPILTAAPQLSLNVQ